jgi:cobalamin biosynthesis protein CobT
MGYIRKFESYKKAKKENRLEVSKPIEEAVIMKVDNTFKVKSIADVTQTLINAYVKKVKEETGKELKDFFSEMDLAEALVKYAIENGLDVDCIPSNALLGENAESAEDDSNEEEATEEEVEETEEEVEETEEEVAEEEVEETEEEEIVAEEEVEETEEEATEEEEVEETEEEVEETEEAEEEISSEELPV